MLIINRFAMRFEMRRGSVTLTNEQIDEAYALMSPGMKRTVLKLYRATDPKNLGVWEQRLLAVTANVPTIVLWGDQDPYIGSQFADRFGARKVRHFKQWGHWIQMESPHEVAQELLAFFGEQAGLARKAG
jgi:pimeloyl-ACP methyl ester carboxylesterase